METAEALNTMLVRSVTFSAVKVDCPKEEGAELSA